MRLPARLGGIVLTAIAAFALTAGPASAKPLHGHPPGGYPDATWELGPLWATNLFVVGCLLTGAGAATLAIAHVIKFLGDRKRFCVIETRLAALDRHHQ